MALVSFDKPDSEKQGGLSLLHRMLQEAEGGAEGGTTPGVGLGRPSIVPIGSLALDSGIDATPEQIQLDPLEIFDGKCPEAMVSAGKASGIELEVGESLEVCAVHASEWSVELTLRKGNLLYAWSCSLPQMQWSLTLDRSVPEDSRGSELYSNENGAVSLKGDLSSEGMVVYGVPSPPMASLTFGTHQGPIPTGATQEELEAEKLSMKLAQREEDEALAAQLDDMYNNEQDEEAHHEILEEPLILTPNP